MAKSSEEKWLRLMKIGKGIGCHQKSSRSFFYKKYQFPVCARCTGILLGEFIIAPIILIIGYNNIYLNLILFFIMAVDGLLQYFDILKSNNIRRLVTGLGAGYAITSSIFWIITILVKILI